MATTSNGVGAVPTEQVEGARQVDAGDVDDDGYRGIGRLRAVTFSYQGCGA